MQLQRYVQSLRLIFVCLVLGSAIVAGCDRNDDVSESADPATSPAAGVDVTTQESVDGPILMVTETTALTVEDIDLRRFAELYTDIHVIQMKSATILQQAAARRDEETFRQAQIDTKKSIEAAVAEYGLPLTDYKAIIAVLNESPAASTKVADYVQENIAERQKEQAQTKRTDQK